MKKLLAWLIIFCPNALAEPVYEAAGDGVRIVIHSEECALKEITNLPRRATWHEGSKMVEGCAGNANGIAVFWFADRTVVALPGQMFNRVVGA
jgi:hypothetical protein